MPAADVTIETLMLLPRNNPAMATSDTPLRCDPSDRARKGTLPCHLHVSSRHARAGGLRSRQFGQGRRASWCGYGSHAPVNGASYANSSHTKCGMSDLIPIGSGARPRSASGRRRAQTKARDHIPDLDQPDHWRVQFLMGEGDGKRTLTIREAQHEHAFVELPSHQCAGHPRSG
jgi:hypothetical protein